VGRAFLFGGCADVSPDVRGFAAIGLIKSVEENADGDYIISGPIHDLQEDYDGDTIEKSGLLNGMKTFWKMGKHIDYAHQYLQSIRRGKPDPDLLIGKGLEIFEVNGIPWLKAKLYKGNELAEKVWNQLRRGVEFGFSLEGLSKARDRKNPHHILDMEIHRITIDPSPKSYGARVQVGVPSNASMLALAKALSAAFARSDDLEIDASQEAVVKAAAGKESKEAVNYREGTKSHCCGNCAYFSKGTCAKVAGAIHADDLCDLWKQKRIKKAVNPDAKYTCPRCGRGMYCIHCHKHMSKGMIEDILGLTSKPDDFRRRDQSPYLIKFPNEGNYFSHVRHKDNKKILYRTDNVHQAWLHDSRQEAMHNMNQHGLRKLGATIVPYEQEIAATRKALTAGEGIVEGGQTGGATLRKQNLRRKTVTQRNVCAACGDEFSGDGRLCARCRRTRMAAKSLTEALQDAGSQNAEAVAAELVAKGYLGFNKLKAKLARRGVRNPAAVAASIGRRKYGKQKFQAAAAHGKKLRGVKPAHHTSS
jgi:hypothetical protein